jgi:hypothetical protein
MMKMTRDDLTDPGFESFVRATRDKTSQMIYYPGSGEQSIFTWTGERNKPWELGWSRYKPSEFVTGDAWDPNMWAMLWAALKEHDPTSYSFYAVACVYDVEVTNLGPGGVITEESEMLGYIAMERWNWTMMGAPVRGVDDYYVMTGPWAPMPDPAKDFMMNLAVPPRRLLTLQG